MVSTCILYSITSIGERSLISYQLILITLFGHCRADPTKHKSADQADCDKHATNDAHQASQEDEHVFPFFHMMHRQRGEVIGQ